MVTFKPLSHIAEVHAILSLFLLRNLKHQSLVEDVLVTVVVKSYLSSDLFSLSSVCKYLTPLADVVSKSNPAEMHLITYLWVANVLETVTLGIKWQNSQALSSRTTLPI
jgi:hypothetical protein